MILNFFCIVAAIALLLLNALFVAAEFGMVKLRETRVEEIKEKNGLRGRILAQIHKNLDTYLSACQVGITLASLGLGWIGEPAFAALIDPGLRALGVTSPDVMKFLSVTLVFILISFLHIVVGELMPKSLAIRQAERVSLWTALPLYSFYWLMYPAILLLNACSNFLLRAARLHDRHTQEDFYSTDEIKLILNMSHSHGALSDKETKIMARTLDFADLEVTDMMRPISEIVALDIQQPVKHNLGIVFAHKYSRYPVFDTNIQKMIGLLHVKDLFRAFGKEQPLTNLRPFLRPILKVHANLPALDLLQKFRDGIPHFALIYDKQKHLIGFITMDNLLHILVGRIKDEFHKTRDDWHCNKDGTLFLQASSSLYTLERALDTDLALSAEEEERLDTIQDLMHSRLPAPQKGQRIVFETFQIEVDKMDGATITRVKVYPSHPTAPTAT